MKKELLIPLLVGIIVVFVAVGAGVQSGNLSVSATQAAVASEAEEDNGGMELVGEGVDGFYYYRDSVTDVMYLWKVGGYKGGLTTMLDPETGLPLTYARYMELSETASKNG